MRSTISRYVVLIGLFYSKLYSGILVGGICDIPIDPRPGPSDGPFRSSNMYLFDKHQFSE